jgi:hypothetical protein
VDVILNVIFSQVEEAKQEFSETVDSVDDSLTFQDLNIARALMKVG